MRIYLNIRAKFQPDLIWNNGVLGFLNPHPSNKDNSKYNNNMVLPVYQLQGDHTTWKTWKT